MAETPGAELTLRDGRYQVLGTLGRGAQGETLEALDKLNGRVVAVKRFRIKGARSWKDIELAEREARVLARLQHQALPRYLEHFEEAGALHLVMDKVEGQSVAQLLSDGRRFHQSDVLRFLRAAGNVLDYLHTQAPPVIHRDLKPGNIVVRSDGSFAFVDFGCVRDSLRPEGGSTVVGTFGYMAPEQFQGRALPASDVYAIGATALTLLTGTEPEHQPHKGLSIDVKKALRGVVPEALVRAIEQMLIPDPDLRAARLNPLLSALPDVRETSPGGISDPTWQPPTTAEPNTQADRPGEPDSYVSRRRRHVRRRAAKSRQPAEHAPRERKPPTSGAEEFGREVEEEVRRAWKEVERELFGKRRSKQQQKKRPTRPGHPRDWQRNEMQGSPMPFAFAALGISIARVVIWATFRVMAPVLLTLLSLFLGPSLRRASGSADDLGKRIDDHLRRFRETVEQGLTDSSRGPHVRVDDPPTRVRVKPEPGNAEERDDEHTAPRPSVRHREL